MHVESRESNLIDASPEVSVVIGVYNAESCLRASLDSVLKQEGPTLECVVVDDGSTDGTSQLLAEYARFDVRMRVIRQQNLGLTRALIVGCASARAPLIARQDAGDISLPGRLRTQVDYLRSRPAAAVVVTGVREKLQDGYVVSTILPHGVGSNLGQQAHTRVSVPAHGCVLFRRAAYDAVGGYRAAFYYAQDCDLWQRLAEYGEIAGIEEVLYESSAEVGGISTSRTSIQMQFASLADRAAIARADGCGDNREVVRADRLRERVLRGRSQRPPAYGVAGAHFRLGAQLEALDPEAARRQYRQALSICPYYWRAWRQLARLRSSRQPPMGST